jgi:hypothetical protein
MTAADQSHQPEGDGNRRVPARVDSSTRVNVALPFSQIKVEDPSDHLLALTGLVQELASLLAEAVPGPEAEALRRRAHELASRAS